jgi:hypothetical protein
MQSLGGLYLTGGGKLVAGDDRAWPEEASRASTDLAQGLQGGDRTGSGLAGGLCRRGSAPSPAAVPGRWRRRPAAWRRCGGAGSGVGELDEGGGRPAGASYVRMGVRGNGDKEA